MRCCSINGCKKQPHARGWCHNHYNNWYRNGAPEKTGHGTVKERFEENYMPIPESGCWVWVSTVGSRGYGQMCINGSLIRAHRLSYILHIDQIPEGMWVLHKCDMPLCVNPNHLFLGTHQDNMIDMVKKGRASAGETRWNSKLKKHEVLSIRDDIRKIPLIAKDYNVGVEAIRAIKKRQTWRHI